MPCWFAGPVPIAIFWANCLQSCSHEQGLTPRPDGNESALLSFSEPNWEAGGFETAYRPKQFDGKSQFFSVYEIYLCTNTSNHHTQYLQMLKTLHAHSNILRCWLLSSIITHLATKNPMCGEAKQRQAMFGYLASIAIAQSWGPSFHSSATSFSWLIWWQISTTLLDQTCKIKMWLVKFQSQRPVYNYCLPNHVGFGSPCACNTQTHVYTYVFAHVPPK